MNTVSSLKTEIARSVKGPKLQGPHAEDAMAKPYLVLTNFDDLILSLGKLCDENGYSYEWINGQKPHLIKDGIRIICNTENSVPIVVPGLSSSSSASSSTSRTPMKQESHSSSSSSSSPCSPTVDEIPVREREDAPDSDISPVPVSELVDEPVEIQANQIPKETTIERGNLCDDSEIPEWLQEFRENLVDDEIPIQGGSHASSSHEASLEPIVKRREDLGKHSVYTHFPKDRNCEICKRTKITRAPCRRRIGGAVLRAENFVDLITADHKVLSEGCESRKCEGDGDVVGVVTPLGGVAQVSFHGVKVVEVGVVLRVHQDRGVEEDGEGQVEVEREEDEVKEKRSCVRMG